MGGSVHSGRERSPLFSPSQVSTCLYRFIRHISPASVDALARILNPELITRRGHH